MRCKSLLLTLTILAGCAAPAAADSPVVTYFADRGNDFLDLFRIRGGVPDGAKGVGLKARATSLAQVGYVFFDGTYAGMERRGIGIVDERRREGGVSLLYGSYNKMVPTSGNDFLEGGTDWHRVEDRRLVRNLPHWDDGRQRYLSLGAEVATPLVAIDLGAYPEEALDLVLGLFTIDIYNDDQLRGYADDLEYQDANALPLPAEDAPFADKQKRMDEFKARMMVEELERLGQAQATDVPAPEGGVTVPPPPNAVEQAIENQVVPPYESNITPDEADEAISEVDNMIQSEAAAPPPPPEVLEQAAEEVIEQKREEPGESPR